MLNDTSAHDTLWKLIKDMRFGMLTHRTVTGMLHAHPLTTMHKTLDRDSKLYFFISRDTELYSNLQHDRTVNVSYANPEADTYVSLCAHAETPEDPALKELLWTPLAKAWFPGGVTDPSLALLVVRIHHAEYWDVKESKMVQLFKMAKAALTGEPPRNLGEHQKLHLS